MAEKKITRKITKVSKEAKEPVPAEPEIDESGHFDEREGEEGPSTHVEAQEQEEKEVEEQGQETEQKQTPEQKARARYDALLSSSRGKKDAYRP